MTPETIASAMREELACSQGFQLYVFWIEEHEDRDQLCRDLSRLLENSGIIPLVLRKRLFVDPNEWAADAMSLLAENRTLVEAAQDKVLADRPLALAVIAKNRLMISQSSSPATAPEWIPKYGGKEILTVTRDMNLVGACTLSSPEAAIGSVCSLLYELERNLHVLVSSLMSKDKHHGQQLWSSTLKERSGLASRTEF